MGLVHDGKAAATPAYEVKSGEIHEVEASRLGEDVVGCDVVRRMSWRWR